MPMERVFRLSGDLPAIHIEEDFACHCLAKLRKIELASYSSSGSTLTIEEMEVPIEPTEASA